MASKSNGKVGAAMWSWRRCGLGRLHTRSRLSDIPDDPARATRDGDDALEDQHGGHRSRKSGPRVDRKEGA